METTTCKHRPTSKSLAMGANVEECTICRQQVRYSPDKYRSSSPTVIQLGRIGDKIVLPDPTHKLELNSLDKEALQRARGIQVGEAEPEEAEPAKPTVRPGDPKGRAKWYHKYRKPMIRDLVNLGEEGFLKVWGPVGVTRYMFPHLKNEVLYQRLMEVRPAVPAGERKQPGPKPGAKPAASKPAPGQSSGLPPLPPWNDKWPKEVQVEWLRSYRLLITFNKGVGP